MDSKFSWARGEWHSIHVTAAWADSPDKVRFFCKWIRHQIEFLPCEECRDDSRTYIQSNPPEKAADPFVWSWQFHNYVNRKLGKLEMPYGTARDLYLGGRVRVCNEGCGDPQNNAKTENSVKTENTASTNIGSSQNTRSRIQDTFRFRPTYY